jgi:predicted dehydrogenase
MNDRLLQEAPPVRWGIVSTANIGRAKVVPAMLASPWCEVRAIASRNPDSARDYARELGIPEAYGSYEELLDAPEIEAVYIPLPNHLHVDMALAAAAKGKHVLCEKPIAMNAADAERLLSVPDDVIVAEAFMVRHHPQWRKLRERLRSGEHGAPRAVQVMLSFSLNKQDDFRFKPEFGGGAMYDLGCYAAMTSRYVFEAEPQRVFCAMERDPANGTDFLASAILDYGQGRHAGFTVGIRMAAAQHLQIVCEKSSFELPAAYVPTAGAPAAMFIDTHAGLDEMAPEHRDMPTIDQYDCEVSDFAKAVRGLQPLAFGIDDAVRQMRVLDALFASARSESWQTL